MKTTDSVLLTVPEMGEITGLIRGCFEQGDVIEIDTIQPDGTINFWTVILDHNPALHMGKTTFWSVFNDGRFQRGDRSFVASIFS